MMHVAYLSRSDNYEYPCRRCRVINGALELKASWEEKFKVDRSVDYFYN
jgi:hypothetical protein